MDPSFEVLPPEAKTPPPRRPARPRNFSGWGLAALIGLFKFGPLLLKSLLTGFTMLISVWVYSFLFGWRFSVGFVVLIFVHEMGHIIAAKWLRMPVSAPIFIPFIGAYINMKQNPRDAWTEALMAYGGPLAGGAGAWACWALALYFQAPWLMAVASTAFVLNLFNLIPAPPLDGGRISAAVSPWFWGVGVLLLGAALFYFQSWQSIALIAILLFSCATRFRGFAANTHAAYYRTNWAKRISMALLYIGLVLVLIAGYSDASRYLQPVVAQ